MTPRALAVLLFLGTAAALLMGLGAAPVARRPEERSYDAARSMVAEGRWLVPTYRGRPRVEKPPLYSWVAALCSLPRGEVTRITLRLPAVLAALTLLHLVYRWGRWLGGPPLGLWAAVCLAGMVQFYDLGRRGVAEMFLALFSTACLYLFARAEAGRGGNRAAALFAAAFGLAFLSKATVACLVVGLPIAAHLALTRRLGTLRQPRRLLALLGGLLLGVSWYVLLLLFRPAAWERLMSELLLPFGVKTPGHSATHYRPVYYFFLMLPVLAAPASLFLPLLWHRLRTTRFFAGDARRRFPTLAWILLLLAFSLFPQKQRHYLLPLLPLLALSLAEAVRAELADPERRQRWLRRVGFAACALVPLLGLLAAGYYHVLLGKPVAAGAAVLAGALVGLALARAARAGRAAVVTGLVMVALWLGEAVYQGSYLAWRNAFRVGYARREDPRWRAVFERYPWAVRILRADRPPREPIEKP